MVFDENALKDKLIEAWKFRWNETTFSASLSPLIAQCQSDEEFRYLFTKEILLFLDSTTTSDLLQTYFKFHSRSGCIDSLLIIERLLSLKPKTSEDLQIKFLLELLIETLKSSKINAENAVRFATDFNRLAKWLCKALTFYLNDLLVGENSMIIVVSNLFLLLFTNSTFYSLWLMKIKSLNEQNLWKKFQQEFNELNQRISIRTNDRPESFQQIFFKLNRLHLSEEFHREDIEFNLSIFNPIVSLVVINQLHRSSSILFVLLRFYENVSTMSNPSTLYLRFLQSAFAGYLSSVLSTNSEYQQRWSAFIHFQLPRILASCFENHFDWVEKAIENFCLYNEFLLNRLDELICENSLQEIYRRSMEFVSAKIREENHEKILRLNSFLQQTRQIFVQQKTSSYLFDVLQKQRQLEKFLREILTTKINDEQMNFLVEHFNDSIPLIFALDQFYPFVRLILFNTENQFDLSLYLLCYLTSICDDTSEDFGQIDLNFDENSTPFFVYVWLKKFWLSRSLGHALFASPLTSIDFLSSERIFVEKDEFLHQIRTFEKGKTIVRSSPIENLSKTIFLLGELQSLALEQTKEILSNLIRYATHVSHGSLIHILLWLIANYQIADENERLWIQNVIHTMVPEIDSNSVIFSLHYALKRKLWADFIDNPLSPFVSIISPKTSTELVRQISTCSSQTASMIIDKLFQTFQENDFLDSEESRAFFVCSKFVPIDLLIIRLLNETNCSNGIYETGRALFFLFGLILFRRRSSTRALLNDVFPSVFNSKSNEFMLEPHVYSMCCILNILLTLELHPMTEKTSLRISFEDSTVIDAFERFLTKSSDELFSTETLRPVNYFFDWFQTILWMFSRTVKSLKNFVKPKLVAQLSEYLPLQFPIEKVLSILDLKTDEEIHFASMVITRDYRHLQTLSQRTTSTFQYRSSSNVDELAQNSADLTRRVFLVPADL